jgi:FkbM family methyltransferase
MLDPLKQALRHTPLYGPARRLYHRLRPRTQVERSMALNAEYDREAEAVLARVLTPAASCIDVGAHTGGILALMRRYAPEGEHWAFEPLPALARQLRQDFPEVHVHELALAATAGPAEFCHVVNAPGYSGLRERRYDRPDPEIVRIQVQTDRLDAIVPDTAQIALIKIDVEGGELGVLTGGEALLRRCRPVVIFEHGRGAAEYYDTRPEPVYDLLTDCGLAVTTMARWLGGEVSLARPTFVAQFEAADNFFFMAAPQPGGAS